MSFRVNPMQIIGAIKNGQNPEQLMINILENQMASTPMGKNLLSLIRAGRTDEIEQIARNATAS